MGVKKIDGDKRWRRKTNQTTILTHNLFFSRQWHAVISSRRHLALLLLLKRRPTMGPSVGRCPRRAPSNSLAFSVTNRFFLAASWDWLKTDCISGGHLYRSFHNAHHFHSIPWLLLYTGASCAEKCLIFSLIKSQYATLACPWVGVYQRTLLHSSLHHINSYGWLNPKVILVE